MHMHSTCILHAFSHAHASSARLLRAAHTMHMGMHLASHNAHGHASSARLLRDESRGSHDRAHAHAFYMHPRRCIHMHLVLHIRHAIQWRPTSSVCTTVMLIAFVLVVCSIRPCTLYPVLQVMMIAFVLVVCSIATDRQVSRYASK